MSVDAPDAVTGYVYQNTDMAAILDPGDPMGLLKVGGGLLLKKTSGGGPVGVSGAAIGLSLEGRIHQEARLPLPLVRPPDGFICGDQDWFFFGCNPVPVKGPLVAEDPAGLDGHLYQLLSVTVALIGTTQAPSITYVGELTANLDPGKDGEWPAPTVLASLLDGELDAPGQTEETRDVQVLLNGSAMLTQPLGLLFVHFTFGQLSAALDTRWVDEDIDSEEEGDLLRHAGLRFHGVLAKPPELPGGLHVFLTGAPGPVTDVHVLGYFLRPGWWEIAFEWLVSIPWLDGATRPLTQALVTFRPEEVEASGDLDLGPFTANVDALLGLDGSWSLAGYVQGGVPLADLVPSPGGEPVTLQGLLKASGDLTGPKSVSLVGSASVFGLAKLWGTATFEPTPTGLLVSSVDFCTDASADFDATHKDALGDRWGFKGGVSGTVCLVLDGGALKLRMTGKAWAKQYFGPAGSTGESASLSASVSTSGKVCVDLPLYGDKCFEVL